MLHGTRPWTGLAAAIAAFGALVHVIAIPAGPAWYAYFGAPPAVIASARAGTWLAPVTTLAIGALMAACAWYALAALGRAPRPPLLRTGLAAMAVLCVARALIVVPLALLHPGVLTTFDMVAALLWGLAGIGFAFGLRRRAPA